MLAIVAVKQHRDDMAAFGLRSLGQHQGGVIAAAVIHQQDFVGFAQRLAGGGGAADQFGQALLLVINGDHHRNFLYRRRTEHINVLQADGAR